MRFREPSETGPATRSMFACLLRQRGLLGDSASRRGDLDQLARRGFFEKDDCTSLDSYLADAVTPDTLVRVFETHARQQQAGAHYTCADVTHYIAANTILPFLLGAVARRRPEAFLPDGPAWQRLRTQPDRYLFEAVRRGVDLRLPPDIETGRGDVHRRQEWNSPAAAAFALPTETWREHVTRRQRCHDLRHRLRDGAISSINDMVTHNLDLSRFTGDFLRGCADPGLLRIFWEELGALTVLDPTCGAGAFLQAAGAVLEPLYDACLDAMPTLLERHADRTLSRRFFVLSAIFGRNLFGVDLMPEAIEVCKLRLLLDLAAAVPRVGGLELLAAACFNLRAGNALVGLSSKDARLDREDLDRSLARTYGVAAKGAAFADWCATHRPFHWPVEFPGVMSRGGFDVVLGNPPYLEVAAVRQRYSVRGYRTERCGNLYALVWERALELASSSGRVGMIVPVAATSAGDGAPLRELLRGSGACVVSSFNDRPARLFGDLEHARLCIVLHEKGNPSRRTFSTATNKWRSVERPSLFQRLAFVETTGLDHGDRLVKVGTPVEVSLLRKLKREGATVHDRVTRYGPFSLHYSRKLSHFVQVLDFIPRIADGSGQERPPSELKVLRFARELERDVFLAVLNSSLFYWLVTVCSDCRNLNRREVAGMPFDLNRADAELLRRIAGLGRALMDDLRGNSRIVPMRYKKLGTLRVQCTYPRLSKALVDEIDGALAGHYGFEAEELDFLINFDVKYRLGEDGRRRPLL